MINTLLVTIDDLLNRQLNAILHHPDFQKLEASWRGLLYLVTCRERGKNVRIRVLDLTWAELSRDVLQAIDFDQSQLFKKIYTQEFDQPGGMPFGILVGDYYVNPKQDETGGNDIYVLTALMGIAAASFAPCILGIHPVFFGVDQFFEFESLVAFARIFDHPAYAKWKKLRHEADARFLNVTMIRFCLRSTYFILDDHKHGFSFKEDTFAHNHFLWGNSVYCLAGVIIRSFQQTGWFYEITGTRNDTQHGGLVDGLIPQYFEDDSSPFYAKPSCETALKYKQEQTLIDLGFIPLSTCAYTTYSVFYTCPTVYQSPHITFSIALRRLSLDSVLCVSRFAHYLKIVARPSIGSFTTADILQNHLQNWILQYTSSAADEITPAFKARYPLHYSHIQVRERFDKPGSFNVSLQITPQHFIESFDENLRLEISLS